MPRKGGHGEQEHEEATVPLKQPRTLAKAHGSLPGPPTRVLIFHQSPCLRREEQGGKQPVGRQVG